MRHFYFNEISIFSPNYIYTFELNSDEKRSEQDRDIENIYISTSENHFNQTIEFVSNIVLILVNFSLSCVWFNKRRKKKILYMELVRCDSRGSSN